MSLKYRFLQLVSDQLDLELDIDIDIDLQGYIKLLILRKTVCFVPIILLLTKGIKQEIHLAVEKTLKGQKV